MTERTFEIPMPSKVTIMVFKSTDPAHAPGSWVIKAMIRNIDVTTGELGDFETRWVGAEPSDEDVFLTVRNMLTHELREQLGMKPHNQWSPYAQGQP